MRTSLLLPLAWGLSLAGLSAQTPAPATPAAPTAPAPDFGPNVFIFDPSMDPADIKAKCDQVYSKEESNQFGRERYAFLFKPGTYKNTLNIGFYTQFYGLGKSPDDVTIDGEIRSDAKWMQGNGTCNFWRGIENLSIAPAKEEMWAVSQAAPLRRVHVKGGISLFDPFEGPINWTSGGYMADCKIDGDIIPGSQQQWFTRNTEWGAWKGGVWNMEFLGVVNSPEGSWPEKPFTTIEKTPAIREKPFLTIDAAGNYSVFAPAFKKDSAGYGWEGDQPGTTIPLDQFYIAHPESDTAATLNAALAQGKNLLLTPGIYTLDEPVKVTRPNTIVLGIGMPTLFPQKGTSALEVADVSGVEIACILFDAGPVSSPVLLQMGEPGSSQSHADNPSLIADIFCRVGGAAVGVAKTCVIINSNDVIGDHAWLWRADHGEGAGWDLNKSTNGLIVNGNNVTYYGLFVEHFQEYQTLWNGENGRDYFYQSELPYDPPTQADWQHGSVKGWASYKVADNVKNHEAWGQGIYCVFSQDNIYEDNAVEAPNVPGVKFHHIVTFRLGGASDNSGINGVVDGAGAASTKKEAKQEVLEYPAS